MKHMDLSKKLKLIFGLVIAVCVILAAFALIALKITANNYRHYIDFSQQRMQAVQSIRYDTMNLRRITSEVRADSNLADREIAVVRLEGHTKSADDVVKSINAHLDAYIDLLEKDPALSSEQIRSIVEKSNDKRNLTARYKQNLIDRNISLGLEGNLAEQAANTSAQAELISLFNDMTYDMAEFETGLAESLMDETDTEAVLLWAFLISFAAVCIAVLLFLSRFIMAKVCWYNSIIDSVPFVVSVIDNDMNFTFLNKAGRDAIGIEWKDLIGRPCNAWAHACTACNTSNCGVECFKRGQTTTQYNTPEGYTCKVDVSALYDNRGKQIGYVELDQDITKIIEKQKAEAKIVKKIGEISHAFVSESKQIADGSQVLAQGSQEQASAIEQLSSSVAEIAEQTKANAEMAQKAASLSEVIKGNAEKGEHQVDEMMLAVKEINTASQNISKIIKVIDDIAFQTNILALNAAVEAARAGQHGKGFAVVAEEVRNLAAKSAEAAKETGGMIQNSMEKAELGSRITGDTVASFVEISSGIQESGRLIEEIAKSSKEQSVAISELNIGIDQVAQVVQQNSATAEESAATSQEMRAQSAKLEELIEQFESESNDTV